MGWQQNASPNLGVQDQAGMCLRFVQSVYGAPVAHPSAWAAWEATTLKHRDANLPNASVPCWFSHMGTYGNPPTYKNWGHVVAYVPSKGFLSSPGNGYGQQWFGSLGEIERYFRATFVGWSEDLNGLNIVSWIPDPTPAPTPSGTTHTVVPGDTLWDISGAYYGDPTRWPEIYAANTGVIGGDPNLIFPGQVLQIP